MVVWTNGEFLISYSKFGLVRDKIIISKTFDIDVRRITTNRDFDRFKFLPGLRIDMTTACFPELRRVGNF